MSARGDRGGNGRGNPGGGRGRGARRGGSRGGRGNGNNGGGGRGNWNNGGDGRGGNWNNGGDGRGGNWNNGGGGRGGNWNNGGGGRGGNWNNGGDGRGGNWNNGGGGRGGNWNNGGGGRGASYAQPPPPGPVSASTQRAAASSASNVQFIRSVLRRSANHQLEQLIGSAERKWLQCWESVGSLPPDAVRTLLSALARLPFSAAVSAPPLSACTQGITTLLQKRGYSASGADDGALDGNDADLEDVELVERLVKRLLKFTWNMQAEDVKAKLVDMIGAAIGRLKLSLSEHLSILPRLTSLIEEMEKPWAIKTTAPTANDAAAKSSKSTELVVQDWREPTVGWLANYKHFQPLLLPKMRDARETDGRVFPSPEEYFTTILKLWVGMTFIEGNNALLPHCTAKFQDKMCDQPLWPLPRHDHSISCRNPQCGRPATFVCTNRNHHVGYCSRCAAQLQQRLCGPPSSRASTHIYDGTIANVRHDGTITLEHIQSRRPPLKEIHWRTTKRLASPNLVGIVPVASREASLRDSDQVYWGQIVFQGQSFDEYKARERGRMTFRLLEYRDEPGNAMMSKNPRPGDAVVVIDCQTFVPEFIPVLKALEMQSRVPLPFKNGALLNLCADADGYGVDDQGLSDHDSDHDDGDVVSDGLMDVGDMTSRYSSTEELVRQMIHVSALAPVIDIRRDSGLRERLERSLVSLVRSATLDGGQLTSFVEALMHPVHCTQGPPGTGKSYLGVVIVRALLVIRDLWKMKSREIGDPPILVLSYKNHAIDEFLLDLLHSEPALNHSQMRFRRYGSGSFQRLIRIGGGCSEQELAPYAERNTAHNDPAVRAVSNKIDEDQKLLEDWQQLRDGFLPILETHSELFASPEGLPITSELRKSVMKVVPIASSAVAKLMEIRALVSRCIDRKKADASEHNASGSEDDSDEVLTLEERVDLLKNVLTEPHSLKHNHFKVLFNGIRHYDTSMDASEVLYQWLIGFRPLPPCRLDACLSVCREGSRFCHDHACAYSVDGAICGDEVVKDRSFCVAHNCSSEQCKAAKMSESRFCEEHSCKFALKDRLCCDEAVRKRLYCQLHLCSAEKCKEPKIDSLQNFCAEHSCFVCLRDGTVALLAADSPPRNVCDLHSLCWGMNGMEMCLQLAVPGQSYCADHEEVLYCKWKAGSGEKCTEIATEGQYCQAHDKLMASKFQKKGSAAANSTQCVVLTKKGRQCRGKRLPGADVCVAHTGKGWSRVADPAPAELTPSAPPSKPDRSTDFVRSDALETSSGENATDKSLASDDQVADGSPGAADGNLDEEKPPSTAAEKKSSSETSSSEDKADPNDEVWSWSSGSEADFAVDDANYDNTDEVEESEHLQHLREVYEVEEAEVSSSESEDEEEEQEQKEYVPTDEMRHEVVLPCDWHWEMALPDRWRAILGAIDSWGDVNGFVQAMFAEEIKILKHRLHQETLRATARVYEGKSIIGGTITGCVARLEAIRMTNPFAVLVEEASEVMEPLLFSCFSSSTVKLEMIGDHLQLQPSVMNRIDFERVNKINISMFERLICAPPGSAAPSSVLSIQRRMRKNICDLTRGFYSEITTIEDHAVCRTKVIGDANKKVAPSPLLSVCEGKGREVPGVLPHVYFWTHKGAEQRATVGLSRINPAEAHMTCSLVKFLVHCGVPPKSIAVLTPYKGQLMLIRKLLMNVYKLIARVNDQGAQRIVPACTVSTVDRFQGDEADVVLISLVIDGKSRTPFVKLQNRMIVLLSRARLGMYIMGNKDYFGETRHWQLTLEALERGAESDNDDSKTNCEVFRGRRIGPALPICCPMHRDSTASASSDKELKLGFCSVVCTEALKCSHPCGMQCHYPNLAKHNEHCAVMVDSLCPRHPRQLTCESVTNSTNAFPIEAALARYPCPVKMEVTRPCGHSIKMQCHAYRDIEEKRTGWPSCTLPAITPFVYPMCKHVLECSCADFERYTIGNAPPCVEKGEYSPPCEHSVTLPCHVRQEHEAGTRLYVCKKKVTVELPRCGHSVSVQCPIAMQFAAWEGRPCLTRGVVTEGVVYGPKDYSCKQMIRFVRKCGHVERATCERAFELAASPSRCLEDVTVMNPECGHECVVKCFEQDIVNVGGTPASVIASAVTTLLSATGVTAALTPTPVSVVKENDPSNHFDYGLKLQCSKEVTLERACGHTEKMKCSDARRLTTMCTEVVATDLPSCGHSIRLPCNLLPELSQWQPWGAPDKLDARQQQAIDRLHQDNVVADDCPVPFALPPRIKQHVNMCRAPIRFWRRATCDHETELKCDAAFRVLDGSNKLPNCVVRVQKTLECGHDTVVDCFRQSEQQRCDQVVECPCWNAGVCGNSVTTKCSARSSDRVLCDKKTEWTCENGHSFTLALCTKGTPSNCPKCSKASLDREIATLKTWQTRPPERLDSMQSDSQLFANVKDVSPIEVTRDNQQLFLGRKLKLLARFQGNLDPAKPWKQAVFEPQSVLCFFELGKKKAGVHLEQFGPCQFSSAHTMMGMEVYEATQENVNRVCGANKSLTLVLARLCTQMILFNPTDVPHKKGQKQKFNASMQSWVATQQRHGFDCVYCSAASGAGGTLTVWQPFAMYLTHRVELTPANRTAFLAHLPATSQLHPPTLITFASPSGSVGASSEEKAAVTTVETQLSDADRGMLQRLAALLSPLYEKLDVQYPWDGKTLVVGGVQAASKVEKILAAKLNFVPTEIAGGSTAASRKPLGGVSYLKNVAKNVPLVDADLFLALELLVVRKQDATDARAKLEAYVKACSNPGKLAHPLVILAIVRLNSHKGTGNSTTEAERKLLELFCRLYPDAKAHWLSKSEKTLVGRDDVGVGLAGSSTDHGAGFSSVEDKWQAMKEEHGCRSEAMDDLLKLVGLRKVKMDAVNLFKKAIAFQQMPAAKRKKNVMAFNYCFVGNPGTGKTTVARLFAQILNDSGVRPNNTIVECTAQKLKDDGADEFRKKIQEAMGGVLFIDEAYELDPMGDFKGKPIVAELLTASEDKRGELSIILAGYEDDIQKKLYAYNDGLPSRFIDVTFEDFDAKELETVWNGLAEERGWEFEPQSATVACRRLARASGRKGFGNARAVRKLFEKAVKAAMTRDDFDGDMFTTVDLIGERPSRNPKLRAVLDEVKERIGWGRIKEELAKLVRISDENYERELQGIDTVPVSLNRLFLGNPGTGKTTCASYYGRVLKALDFLSNGEVVKKTAGDCIGSHVGESQTKTAQILDMARGKVLVIDEAYNLNDGLYGKQVLDVLVEKVQGTESDDIAVVLIGYEHEMTEMLRTQNPGLRRRFPPEYAFHFDDYSEHELLEILEWNCANKSVTCPLDVAEVMLDELSKQKSQANFGNAGAVEQLLKHAMASAVGRPMVDGKMVLTLADVGGGEKPEEERRDPLDALKSLYRVDNIRQQLVRLRNEMLVAQREGSALPEVGHFVFRGSPGTGKTTVARVMAQVLHEMGALATNKLVETSGVELTGEYLGQTKKKVTEQLGQARGGVLFIDEAYELGKGIYGEEAMTTLVAALTDPTYRGLVVVIAGYPSDINVMLDRNAGLKSRFTRYIDFEDWAAQDAVVFVCDKADKENFVVAPEAVASLQHTFAALKALDGFGNGRDASRMWKELVQCRAQRVVSMDEAEPTITGEDAELAGAIMLAGRRPPNAPLLSQSSSSVFDPSMLQLDQKSTLKRIVNVAESEAKLEEQAMQEGEQKSGDEQDESEDEDEQDDTQRDPGVSDEVWAELERAKKEHAAHLAELKRLRDAATREEERRKAQAMLEEERRKAAAVQERIRRICPCPAGFKWYKSGGGWRCCGGSHFVSDAQLENQFTC